MEELQVSSIADIKKALAGELVSLPPFVMGTEFTVRLKRVSIASLVRAGKIPNPLLQSVYSLFKDKPFQERIDSERLENSQEMKEFMKFIDIVVAEALVSPTAEELEREDIFLTDEQKNGIFQYIQQGAAALAPFRLQQGNNANNTNGESLSHTPQSDIRDAR